MSSATNSTPALYRHGDVLVGAIGQISPGAKKRPHLVLAEGEMTGHSHRIAEPGSAVLLEAGSQVFLRVLADTATLIHQEHGPISLSKGEYRVWQQREYSPREIRVVRD